MAKVPLLRWPSVTSASGARGGYSPVDRRNAPCISVRECNSTTRPSFLASPPQSGRRTAGGSSPPLTSKTTYRPERFATILGTRLKDKTLEVADLFPQVQESSAAAVRLFVTLNHRPASFSTVFAAPATLLWTLVRCAHGVGEFVHGRCVVANRIAARTVHRVRTIRLL